MNLDNYFKNDEKVSIKRSLAFQSSVYQWNIVFYVSAAIYFLGNLVFVIFGTGEVQWWNDPEARRQKWRGDKENETQT